ncbi:AraC family transcriptional regulator [Cystobacter fuscus]
MLDFRTYGPAAALHTHDFVQVVMPSHGVLEMEVDGRGGRVDAHHAAIIPAGAAHAFEATGRNRFIVLDLAVQAADTPDLGNLSERVFFPLTPGLRALSAWLHTVHAPEAGARIDAALVGAWSSLALATLAAHPANTPTTHPVRPDSRAERVWRAIDRRFAESLTLDELAAGVGLSGRRLASLFRAAYGTTVHARLAGVRLRHAVSLLERTTLPIGEVAACSGYYDQSALTRHLKAALGTTPAALRRGQRA